MGNKLNKVCGLRKDCDEKGSKREKRIIFSGFGIVCHHPERSQFRASPIWLNLGLLKTSTDLERNSNSPKFIFKEDNLAKQLQLVGQGAEFKFLSL